MLPRPCNHLSALKNRYQNLWKQYDIFLEGKGRDLPNWPAWCFCPLAAAYSIVSQGSNRTLLPNESINVAILGALAAWRPSQGIYRFDPDVAAAVMDTDLDGALPSDLFLRLPEWCVYIEMPVEYHAFNYKILGFFAHLEWDAQDGHAELRLLLDAESKIENLIPIPMHIDGKKTLVDALAEAYLDGAIRLNYNVKEPEVQDALGKHIAQVTRQISPLIGLVLYLCSKNAEVKTSAGKELALIQKPAPKKTKNGIRYFPPDRPEIWEVGFRLGEKIRVWQKTGDRGTHASPRPHIRRAHWHTFWEGPMSEPEKRTTGVKWLPPIPVNVEEGEVMPTVKKVQ